MNRLLDTCALFALSDDGQAFSAKARKALNSGIVWISAISAFEIAQKYHGGKLHLPLPPSDWFPAMLRQHRIEEFPLHSTTGYIAASLPPIHKAPFDHLIIATALEKKLTILTCDQTIPTYPGINTVW